MARAQTTSRAGSKGLSGGHGASQPTRKKGKQASAAKGAVAVRVKSKARFGKGARSFGWFKPTEEGFVALYKAPVLTQVEWVKSGLGARDAKVILGQLRVSQGEALTALHIPVATVNRKAKTNAPLSPAEGERVLGFGRLLGQLQTMVRESGNPGRLRCFGLVVGLDERAGAGTRWRSSAGPHGHDDGSGAGLAGARANAERRVRLSRIAYRIGTDTPDYEADDLSGKGAEITGGRWNEKGVAVVYAAESRSLACLETLVHLAAGGLPFNRYLVEISIPDPVWAAARRETPASLPVGWDAEPASRASIGFGTEWLRSGRSAVLVIPSVIVPEECCVLVNPAHPDSASIRAIKSRRWLYDPRLTRAFA